MSGRVRLAVFVSVAWLGLLWLNGHYGADDGDFIFLGVLPLSLIWGVGWVIAASSPRVRRAVLCIATAGLVLVTGFLHYERRRYEREAEAARQRVPVSDIVIEDVGLLNDSFTGRVRNNNTTYTLTGIDLAITVKDCPELSLEDILGPRDLKVLDELAPKLEPTQRDFDKELEGATERESTPLPPERSCDVVGQSTISSHFTVPPGQVRDISELVFFSPRPIYRGQMVLSFDITEVRARQ